MFFGQKGSGRWNRGQASVEYLLVLTAVFLAFAGVTALFSRQVHRYIEYLFDVILLPF
jgi:hypothetical protein